MGKQQTKNSFFYFLTQLLVSTLFVVAFLSIVLHLIYLYSEEPIVAPQLQYLHRTFKKQPYSKIYEGIAANKYSAITTNCKECTNQIINYYGAKNDKVIVHRDYASLRDIEAQTMPYCWTIRALIQYFTRQRQPTNKVWVFWVSKLVPKQDIEQIRAIEPASSIILVMLNGSSKRKIKEKGFKDLGRVEEFDLVKVLKSVNFSKKQAEGFIKYHHHDVGTIFSSILQKFSNLQSELGQNYVKIGNLTKKSRSILRRVCINGTQNAVRVNQTVRRELESAGIQIENQMPRWKSDRYILNYMMQTTNNCTTQGFSHSPKVAPSTVNQEQKCVCKPKRNKKTPTPIIEAPKAGFEQKLNQNINNSNDKKSDQKKVENVQNQVQVPTPQIQLESPTKQETTELKNAADASVDNGDQDEQEKQEVNSEISQNEEVQNKEEEKGQDKEEVNNEGKNEDAGYDQDEDEDQEDEKKVDLIAEAQIKEEGAEKEGQNQQKQQQQEEEL